MKKFFILLMVVLMLAGLTFSSFAIDQIRDRDCGCTPVGEANRLGVDWPTT